MNQQDMIQQMFINIQDHAKQMMAEGRATIDTQVLAADFISTHALPAPSPIKAMIGMIAERVVNRDEYTVWFYANTDKRALDYLVNGATIACIDRGIL